MPVKVYTIQYNFIHPIQGNYKMIQIPVNYDSDIDYSLFSTVDDSQLELDMSVDILAVCRLNHLCKKSNIANANLQLLIVLLVKQFIPVCPDSSDQCLAAIMLM